MKKLILLALAAVIMAGCKKRATSIEQPPINKRVADNYMVVELDSCEYIQWFGEYGFQHKGNCKFCKERRQKELEELVIRLKEK